MVARVKPREDKVKENKMLPSEYEQRKNIKMSTVHASGNSFILITTVIIMKIKKKKKKMEESRCVKQTRHDFLYFSPIIRQKPDESGGQEAVLVQGSHHLAHRPVHLPQGIPYLAAQTRACKLFRGKLWVMDLVRKPMTNDFCW